MPADGNYKGGESTFAQADSPFRVGPLMVSLITTPTPRSTEYHRIILRKFSMRPCDWFVRLSIASRRVLQKGCVIFSLVIVMCSSADAQPVTDGEGDVGIGTLAPHPSAVLDLGSRSKGFLLSRMTTLERDNIVRPANGLTIYNTTDSAIQVNCGDEVRPIWCPVVLQTPGTSLSTTLSPGAIWYGGPDSSVTELTIAPAGSILFSNSVNPVWGSPTDLPFWHLEGNSGTLDGVNFLGTTDNAPLNLRVNNQRAFRIEPAALGPNIIGGHPTNTVALGFGVATIAGGGAAGLANTVSNDGGSIGGGVLNVVSGSLGTIAGGQGHTVSGSSGFIGGGITNTVAGPMGAVVGGLANAAGGNLASVGGGSQNSASGFAAHVGGGSDNQATMRGAVVNGGENNQATGVRAIVGGGRNNLASGLGTVVAGGERNQAGTDLAVVGGGQGNSANGAYAVVSGGLNNMALNNFAVVGGGTGNHGTGELSIVGGGSSNRSEGNFSVVAGGLTNRAASSGGVVVGGGDNLASGQYSTVGGGSRDTAFGSYSVVAGGRENIAVGLYATAGGGQANRAEGNSSFIGGGTSNVATGLGAAAVGGNNNLASGLAAVVGGGSENRSIGQYATVSGGTKNDALSTQYGTISGGQANVVSMNHGTVGGGGFNLVSGIAAVVGGGTNNRATLFNATISGGDSNWALASYAFIGGGFRNSVLQREGTVGGGGENISDGQRSTVAGGGRNRAQAQLSAIGGGDSNTIRAIARLSTVAGGQRNELTGPYSAIPGGRDLILGQNSFGFNGDNSNILTDLSPYVKTAYLGGVDLWLGNVDGNPAGLRFYEPNANPGNGSNFSYTNTAPQPAGGSNYTAFRAQSQSTNINYLLPAVGGAVGQTLKVSGVLGSEITLAWQNDNVSDSRFKTEVLPIKSVLKDVLRLQGVTWQWRSQEFPDYSLPKGQSLGFIAQDVEALFPSLVHTDNRGYKSIDYKKITALLVEALKEQQAIVAQQGHLLELVQQKIETIEKR